MHNTARGEYVEEQMDTFSREYVRNRILANYRRLAPLGSMFPRTTNFVMGLSATQWLGEKLLGITSERELPAFATETFREWWMKRGGNATSKSERRRRESRGIRESLGPCEGSRPASRQCTGSKRREAHRLLPWLLRELQHARGSQGPRAGLRTFRLRDHGSRPALFGDADVRQRDARGRAPVG